MGRSITHRITGVGDGEGAKLQRRVGMEGEEPLLRTLHPMPMLLT